MYDKCIIIIIIIIIIKLCFTQYGKMLVWNTEYIFLPLDTRAFNPPSLSFHR